MTYEQTLEFLYSQTPAFHNVGAAAYKPGLENTERLMSALGNPHKKFSTIHIAGTNGKGSISHCLAACLQTAGYKTGLYTSPHLVDFGERIRINGQKIDRQYVIDFVKNNKNLLKQIKPSFFEFAMAMAFCRFADKKIEIAVIETGLGGRLDSTNIISPILSVITNIALDHTEFLGNTFEKIAVEKAGIIKYKTPVVVGEAIEQTSNVFVEKAKEQSAPLFFTQDKYEIRNPKFLPNSKMSFQLFPDKHNELCFEYVSGLSGLFQMKNLATVFNSIDVINKFSKFNISADAVSQGLANVCELTGLQGRWQTISENPKIIIDTGHNAAGIAEVVRQIKTEQFDVLHIVFGMSADKDSAAVLALLPKNANYYFTQAKSQRALSAEKLCEQAAAYGLTGKAFPYVFDAVTAAKKAATENDLIFVGGSNFVVGEVLQFIII